MHDKACANIKKAQANQKRQYDAKHNTNTHLKVGDKVLVENKRNDGRKGGKLDVRFPGGPYITYSKCSYMQAYAYCTILSSYNACSLCIDLKLTE